MKNDEQIFTYEVMPVNFIMLPEAKQEELIDRFHQFLNTLNSRVRILVAKGSRTINIGEESFETSYYRFFLESYGEALDNLLSSFGLLYQRVIEIPKFDVVRVFPKHLVLPEGRLMKCFTVYTLPGQLVEGFISEAYGASDQVSVELKPIPPEQATVKTNKYVKFLRGTLLADESRRRTPDAERLLKYQMAEEALNTVISGRSRLFEARAVFTVSGKDRAELNANAKIVKDTLQSRMVRLDSPRYLQYPMATGRAGKKLIVDTVTAGTFFPFVSADVIELPDGLFLGMNRLTGAPILFDPYLRSNYNISILGVTGSGKSFSSKMLLTRMLQRRKEEKTTTPFFIIDPENEYGKIGELLGANVITFSPGEKLGLDPISIFPKLEAADIIADITHLPPQHHATLRTLVNKHRNLEELYSNLPGDVKQYLESIARGPEAFIFQGKPLEFTSRMVFSLRNLESEFLKQVISILVFGKIWQILNDDTFIPKEAEKIVVVDEAWLYMALPAAAKFLERTARLGRKRNILFLVMTQRPADVLGESRDKPGPGRTIIENSATKILLKQDEISADTVAETFGLSEAERDQIVDLRPGQGLLIAENVHVPIQFIASKEEYALFTTKPSDLA